MTGKTREEKLTALYPLSHEERGGIGALLDNLEVTR
jgi:hypothetical protein